MRLLITGSQGRIGRFVSAALEAEHDLVLLDIPPAETPHPYIQGDLCDEEVAARAVDRVEGIVHLAANPHPTSQTYQRNTLGTWNLCTAAAAAGVRRIAFASSINAYGQGKYKIGPKLFPPPYLPIDENVPCRPDDSYGLSKVANEEVLRGFSDSHGICAYCFRLPGVWRPPWFEQYVPKPLEAVSPLTIGNLIDPWHYIHVEDVASAFKKVMESTTVPEYAVSYLTAEDTTRPEPTVEIFERFLPELLPLGADRIAGHEPWFSSERAKRDLGWRAEHSWRRNSAQS